MSDGNQIAPDASGQKFRALAIQHGPNFYVCQQSLLFFIIIGPSLFLSSFLQLREDKLWSPPEPSDRYMTILCFSVVSFVLLLKLIGLA
jgi:hypothetical protein